MVICSYASAHDSIYVLDRIRQVDTLQSSIQRIEGYTKLIPIARKLKFSDNWIKNNLEYRIGQNYSRIGDFKRAQEINLEFIKYYGTIGAYEDLFWAYSDLGTYHFNDGDFLVSLKNHKIGLGLCRKHRLESLFIDSYQGIADDFIALGQMDSASLYIEKMKHILKTQGSDVYWESRLYAYSTLGQFAEHKNDLYGAEIYYNKALEIADAAKRRKGADIGNRLATIYLGNQQLDKCIAILGRTLNQLGVNDSITIYDAYLMGAYSRIAKAFFIKEELDSVLFYTAKAEQQYTFFIEKYAFDQSKISHSELRRSNLELAVQTYRKLYVKSGEEKYLTNALLYANRAKSNLLNERLNRTRSISDESKIRRSRWLYELHQLDLESSRYEAIQLRNRIDSLDQSLGLKEQKIFGTEELKNLQASLSSYQLILQYFFINDQLYTFAISKDNIKVTTKAVEKSKIIEYYQFLQNPKSSYDDYCLLGKSLYNQLLGEPLKVYSPVTELVIIPDKSLNYMVFGSLPMKVSQGWSNTTYVGNNYTITYDFSLQTLVSKGFHLSSGYAGFAPSFDASSSLSHISGNEAAVKSASSILGGNTYLAQDASVKSLREKAVDASILQLYTHAVSSDSSFGASYIHLQDRKIYVDEILTLPLQTKLCILTACEVGLGKEYSGEGVTGVSWAFRAAGADNVVQSLWRINQESSKAVMTAFFEHLSEGLTSEKALQLAKQDYVKNEDISERMKHPYYWAGITHYGVGMTADPKLWSLANILLLAGALSIGVFGAYVARQKLKS